MPPQSFDPFRRGNDITVVDALRNWATQKPDSRAFTFLPDGETEQGHLTYSKLDLRARSIAAALDGVAAAGDRALLLYPSDADFVTAFFGCLYAGITAVPAYPIDPARLQRTVARLISIIADAEPTAVLTTTATLRMVEQLIPQHPELGRVRWIATETIPDNPAAGANRSIVAPEQLAVLQYTSGSTGTPRGVRVTHRNILENARLMNDMYSLSSAYTLVTWLPLSHDLGLFAYVVHPVLLGTQSMVMPPEAFLQKPVRWLRTISRFPVVSSAAPNFAYALCLRRLPMKNARDWICPDGWWPS